MRRIFGLVVAVAVAFAALQARGAIYGVWKGMLLGKLPLVINVVNDSTATVSSPAQGASEMPCAYAKVSGDSLSLSMPQLGLSFRGVYRPSTDRMRGLFVQGMPMQVDFVRGVEADMYPERPQTPAGPFEYREEEVGFRNGDVELRGTLTLPSAPPSKPGGYTAVVLASGSGIQNRDEELLGHKPFAVIADHLTRSGVAVLRFDDRGAGESGPLRGDETTLDFADDVMAAVDYLRSREEVDSTRTGIIGHSEGGTIALMNAARFPERVGFVVSLAGMAVKGEELMVKQNEEISALAGKPLTSEEKTLVERMFSLIAGSTDSLTLATGLKPMVAELHPGYTPAQVEADVAAVTRPWYVAFVKLDPGEYLPRISCPVLALNGTWDVQVDAEANLGAIARAVPGAETVALEGLNHMFQKAATRGGSMNYGSIPQTISPEVLALLARYLSER